LSVARSGYDIDVAAQLIVNEVLSHLSARQRGDVAARWIGAYPRSIRRPYRRSYSYVTFGTDFRHGLLGL